MKKTTHFSIIICLLLLSTSTSGQQNTNFYIANITGASSILLNKVDKRSVDYSIDHRFVYGTIYPNDSGIICLNLPHGEYEYIAEREGMKSKHGTFYISNRDIYFDVQLSTVTSDSMGEEINSSRQLVHDGNLAIYEKDYKKAREMFRLAAIDGNADGMYNYSFMLKNGVGGRKDKEQAFYWLKQALIHGHYNAEKRLQYFNKKWTWGVSSGYDKTSKFIP